MGASLFNVPCYTCPFPPPPPPPHTHTHALSLSPFPSSDARNMARDVQNVLLQIVQEEGKKDANAASEYIKRLQKRGRYLQDVWS